MDEDYIPGSFFLSLSLSFSLSLSHSLSLVVSLLLLSVFRCCSLTLGVALLLASVDLLSVLAEMLLVLYVRRLGCAVFRAIGFIVNGLHQRASLSFFFLFFMSSVAVVTTATTITAG